jgi:hypothetical protein
MNTATQTRTIDAAAVGLALKENGLDGSGWINESDRGLSIFLNAASDNDLNIMRATARIEKETGRKTTIMAADALSPAEQDQMTRNSQRI